MGAVILFVFAGILLGAVGRLLTLLMRHTRKTHREGAQAGASHVDEPSLAELLAETGWRINPNAEDRELARRAIPLIALGLLAFLLLLGGSDLGWSVIGLAPGWHLPMALQRAAF